MNVKWKKDLSQKSKIMILLVMTAVLLFTAVGCGDGSDGIDGTDPEISAVNPDDEIVLAGYRNLAPGEKDGYYCSVILYVWEPLVKQDDNASPIPGLAESWEMSEDGKEWTFSLREGVRFHDGTPFDADAVIANFDRMAIDVKTSAFYPLDIDSHYPGLVSYEKTGEYEVKLTFDTPSPTQIYNMVNFGSPMYSPACFDEDGNFSGIAQGTGPFRIAENVLDEYVLLERNEEYYGELAKAAGIRVRVIPDADTRFSALKAGEIMGVLDLNAIPGSLAVELESDPEFALTTTKSTMIRFLIANGTQYPFDDVRMRQAVSLALDRDVIVNDLYQGFGSPAINILNYCTPFFKEIEAEKNMEEAKRLAEEVLSGERYEITYMINGAEPAQKTEAELIASWLGEIGLDVKILPLEYATMREEMAAGNHHLARSQQGLSNSEPSTIFRRFMLESGDHNQNYSLGYHNEEVEQLMAEASASLDMKLRTEIYERLQEISAEDLPVIPLFNDVTLMAYSTRLSGYEAKIYGLELANIGWAQ